jgi:hypothetical protein
MTAVINGTNGLLQAYDYQTSTTGFSYTFAAGTQVLVMNPAGTLATGTITMPASPSDGMTITFSSSQQISALTLNGNTGQSVVSAVTFLPAKTGVSYVYRSANTSWYPTVTVPGTGSQLVSSTAVASTSGTSITFSNLPSWVKRITLMFQGVSTNGSADYLVRIGAGSTTTTGYLGTAGILGTTNTQVTYTAGWGIASGQGSGASSIFHGMMTITLLGSNNWVSNSVWSNSNTSYTFVGAGSLALGGTLDRVVLTTTNGTDTFDAGLVNILYE